MHLSTIYSNSFVEQRVCIVSDSISDKIFDILCPIIMQPCSITLSLTDHSGIVVVPLQ